MSLKKCSKCQTEFTCGNEKPGCWCEDLYLDLETLKKLKSDFENCLCKECLKSYEKIN